MRKFILSIILMLASIMYADTYDLNNYIALSTTTAQFTTGAAFTSTPTYTVYEAESGSISTTEIISATAMSADFDSETGFHTTTFQLTAGSGFNAGNSYIILYKATVDAIAAIYSETFNIRSTPLAVTSDITTAHATTDGLINGIDDNPWDAGSRTLTELDEDNTTIDLDGTATDLSVITGDKASYKATGFSIHSAADVWSVVTRILTELDEDNTTIDLDGTATDLSAITGDKDSYKATGFAVAGEPLTAQEVEDTVWDAVLTGASHNDPTSAGRRVRLTESTFVLSSGTAQAGTASTIQLAAAESVEDNYYQHAIVVIIGGTGVGQARAINTYTQSNDTADIVPNWITNPAADSEYVILADTEKHVYEIHAGAISAATFAADVDAEIASYIFNALTNAYGGVGTYGQAIEDTIEDTDELQSNQGNWLTATSVNLEDDAITSAKVTDTAWQELIELFYSFDATGAYGDESGSVVDQIADNAGGGGGGDATAANQAIIIADIAEGKGTGFVEATHSQVAIRTRGDSSWLTGAGSTPADMYTDITTSPWEEVYHLIGDPLTEYYREGLYTAQGTPIVSSNMPIGKRVRR